MLRRAGALRQGGYGSFAPTCDLGPETINASQGEKMQRSSEPTWQSCRETFWVQRGFLFFKCIAVYLRVLCLRLVCRVTQQQRWDPKEQLWFMGVHRQTLCSSRFPPNPASGIAPRCPKPLFEPCWGNMCTNQGEHLQAGVS